MLRNYRNTVFIQCFLILTCVVFEYYAGENDKYLNGFIDYMNNLPNEPYVYEDGILINKQNGSDNEVKIDVSLKVSEIDHPKSFKLLKCTAILARQDDVVTVQENSHECHEEKGQPTSKVTETTEGESSTLEGDDESTTAEPAQVQEEPVKLEDELQSDTAATSGEQFVAIPRPSAGRPCIGCSSYVNTSAPGVQELSLLGIRHLDRHEPNVRHSLGSVIEVERQVQAVNGVRYILTLNVNYNNCTGSEISDCAGNKTCKISILEKPWVKLPDGSKFRAILANNCTEEWQFGDDGEVLPVKDTDDNEIDINPTKNIHIKSNGEQETDDALIKTVYKTDLKAVPSTAKTLTEDEIKNLEEQIIPNDQFSFTTMSSKAASSVIKSIKTESSKQVPVVESQKTNPLQKISDSLPSDKKTAIDDLMNFFNYAGLDSDNMKKDENRPKRSYDEDLHLLKIAKKYKKLTQKIKNGKYLYSLGEILVNYMNEIDLEVKTRVLKDVLKVEEDVENHQHFYYIQALVTIPCDKVECDNEDSRTKICNAVIETSTSGNPQVLTHFCHKEIKLNHEHKQINVPLDDPVLKKISEKALKKIESETSGDKALIIKKIIDANINKGPGTVTRLWLEIAQSNCSTATPFYKRSNCHALINLGFEVCDVLVHERPSLKQKKFTYTCTKRPIDEVVSSSPSNQQFANNTDPKILEMVQEALQYLEIQSERNNKLKVVDVISVITEFVAGFLTKIKFRVGYTTCNDDKEVNLETCKLVDNEPLKICNAEIWDRSWLEDGKRINVTCDDIVNKKENNIEKLSRKKRYLVGGLIDKNPSDKEFLDLAEESLQKYIQTSGASENYRIVEVKKVTQQLVSGIITNIDFTISTEDSPLSVINCHSNIWEKSWLNWKEIDISCDISSRNKLQVTGGNIEKDPNDPKYRVLAEESLQKYKLDTGDSLGLQILSVDNVVEQIVAGLKTKVDFTVVPTGGGDPIKCHSEIWERSWLNSKEIDISCDIASRNKRFAFGGDTKKDPSDPKYRALAEESLQKYKVDTGDSRGLQILSVDNVVEQIVAGLKTKVDFTVVPTGGGDPIKCHSEIWERSWLNSKEIDISCDIASRNKRQVAGGESKKDPSDPKYRVLAEESLQKYKGDTGDSRGLQILSVDNVVEQIVAGLKTKVDFTVVPTGGGDPIKCHSEIWERSWLNSKEIDISCDIASRNKRQVAGGESKKDPSDPKYRALAEESLQKYKGDTGDSRGLQILSVDNVVEQIVAGLKTKVDFTVVPTGGGDPIKCHSEIWERSWLNSKEIDISCDIASRNKRFAFGGDTKKDPSDPKYRALAEESLQKYKGDTGDSRGLQILSVDNVVEQIVAGLKTKVDFTVVPTGGGDPIKCHSEIWERSWLNSKEIDISCDIASRNKRQVAGGESKKDPSDPKYRALAEESLQKYKGDTGDSRGLQILSVDNVVEQIVAGLKTKVDFTVVPTGGGDPIKCHSEIWERSWLNSKEIDISCDIASRNKRQVAGGESKKDPSDPKYRALAEESLQKYKGDTGDSRGLQILSVDNVVEQIVAGLKTKVDFTVVPTGGGDPIKCHSEIWERSWLNSKEIDISCDIASRNKRQVAGGESKKDPSDPKYRALAEESLQKYKGDTGDSRGLQIISVDNVVEQIVAGLKTKVDFTVVPTGGGDPIKCHSEIWERSWLNSKEIDISCDIASRNKRQVAGGESKKDPSDPKYRALAEESLQKYKGDTGHSRGLQILSVDNVVEQIVAGLKTKVDFTVVPTGGGDPIKCHSEIWERSWLNSKEIDISCDIASRNKRQVAGGESKKDPSDPKYRALAEESLQKYKGDTGDSRGLQILSVDNVVEQIVAGLKTKVDFTVVPTGGGDPIKCHSEIWERSWLNSKEIDISCDIASRNKRFAFGGDTKKDPSDPKYRALAEESLQKYKVDTGDSRGLQILSVDNVVEQIVAGLKTKVDFTVVPTGGGDPIKCHSEIWERSWLNSKEIDISCDIASRNKRQVAGGESKKDPSDPKYRALAEESLQKYKGDTGDSRGLQILSVDNVVEQIVAGLKTKVDFTVVPTGGGDPIKCHSEIWERSWLNSKEIDISCDIASRNKRQVAGGESKKDPSDPKYRALAEESLQKYKGDTGDSRGLQILSVDNVVEQIVAGLKTKVDFTVVPTGGGDPIKCHSEIWERSWLNSKEIDISCDIASRNKRFAFGGDTKKDPSDPKYRALAEESLQKYKGDTGDSRGLQILSVDNVVEQIVAGLKTKVDFTVVPTGGGDPIKCHSEIWERSWLNSKEIDISCDIASRNKRQVAGGESKKDPSDPKYRALAEESLQKYKGDTGDSRGLQLLSVDNVVEQIVAGLKTKVDFTVVPTGGGDPIKCHSEIWERSWLNSKEIDISCDIASRNKRFAFGGDTKKDPSDPKYRALAEESLQKYKGDTGDSRGLQILSVDNVVEQIVAGLKTKVDFTVVPTGGGDPIKCHSEIWERSWLNSKEIDISCDISSRNKRQVAGGESKKDPSDPKYRALAEESLQKYKGDTGDSRGLQILSVDNVVEQIVAGLKTKVDFTVVPTGGGDPIKCHSEIWERSWLNSKEIDISCDIASRNKRQVAGGESKKNPSDPKYRALAEESLQKYKGDTGDSRGLQILSVDNVVEQIVAGLKTKVDFTVVPTGGGDPIKCHSEIWERSWLNSKEIDISCDIASRNKRQVAGGESTKDPSDPKYRALAEESLQKYKGDTGDSRGLQILSVDNVVEQIVAGLMTKVDFTVVPTGGGDPIKCHSEIWERSWLNSKEIDISCDIASRNKRQVAGGESKKDPSDPKYRALAEESLQKYKGDTGDSRGLQILSVDNVVEQIVAGLKTKVDFTVVPTGGGDPIKCHSEIWERSWLNSKEIDISCDIASRNKRQVAGGESKKDPSDPKYRALAEESLQKYKGDTGDSRGLQIISVDNVVEQIVAGLKTKVDFTVVPTGGGDPIKCHSEIWERSWLNSKEIDISCDIASRNKRQVAGGESKKDPSDPKYRALAEESLQKYKGDTGDSRGLQIISVDNVVEQIVAGLKTKVDFTVVPTGGGDPIKCHSEIWERSWLNSKEIDISCDIASRNKRQVAGGESKKDPSDPKYRALAEESLQKYKGDTGDSRGLQILSVDNVVEQIVAGLKTKVDFTVVPTGGGDPIKCHSEIWERSWLNSKEIDISCDIASRNKRQVAGGESKKDPSDPKYRALAEESLQKYKGDTGDSRGLQILSVDNVVEQIVAGLKTKVDFTVVPTGGGDPIKCHSEIWERSWLNSKEIDISCDIASRNKRQVAGGESKKDPSDPKYRALAEESLQKYKGDTGDSRGLQILSVDNVVEQIVAGLKTKVDFTVVPTGGGDPIKCHSEIWERSWLNSKEIDISCDISSRNKRQVAGGESKKDPSDPKYRALAEESLQKYKVETGDSRGLQILSVDNVVEQIVAGLKTKVDFTVVPTSGGGPIKCHSEIWERSWLNSKEIDISCDIASRNKRQVAGGESKKDPSDPKYRALAEESLQKYKGDTGDSRGLQILSVDNVVEQIVAGLKTKVDFTVVPTGGGDPIKCHSEIWERSWLNSKEIDISCDIASRNKRQVAGGESKKDPSDPKYRALAEESLQKYKGDTGDSRGLQILSVDNVVEQIVAGLKTKVDFTVVPTGGGDPIKCHSEIWERSWLNSKEIDISCDIASRNKRQVAGGESKKDPSDPKYRALAEESLQKYKVDTGDSRGLQILSVDNVVEQIVAGLKTKVDFTVVPTGGGDPIKCHSEIWERSWLNSKEIDISCGLRNKRQVAGGNIEKDPNDQKYRDLAEESLQKYKLDTGDLLGFQILSVDNVVEQPVAGLLTKVNFTVVPTSGGGPIKCHSEIWERSWLNSKEIDISCGLRNKRQVAGGESKKDPSDPKYRALAEESLQKYKVDTGDSRGLQILSVDNVVEQIVAGLKTKVDFTVVPTGGGDPIKCHSEIWERSWLNSKEIDISCDIASRNKRFAFGGDTKKDPSDPKYRALAEESLQKYKVETGDSRGLQILSVDNVVEQIVAGLKTKVDFTVVPTSGGGPIKCHSEIWERSWLNSKEIDISCGLRNKRQVAGGNIEKDPNDQKYRDLAEESLQKYKLDTGDLLGFQILSVDNVVEQPVAGLLTKVNFTVVPTGEGGPIKCYSKIWERSWLNRKDIDVNCLIASRKKRSITNISNNEISNISAKFSNAKYSAMYDHMVGGIEKLSPDDDHYIKLAEESLRTFLTSNSLQYAHKLMNVKKVERQLVAGLLYRIEFDASPTKCLISEVTDSIGYQCDLQDPQIVLHCHSRIWERPWLQRGLDIDVTCDIDNPEIMAELSKDRSRRQAKFDEDDFDEDLKFYYADLVAKHLNELSDNKNMEKLIAIHTIKSGMHMKKPLVRMYVETAPTYCLRGDDDVPLSNCDEIEGQNHRLCFARLWPSIDDELIVESIHTVCDDEKDFSKITGLSALEFVKAAMKELEKSNDVVYKLVHLGEPHLNPTLDSREPIKLSFLVGTTNCSKDININKDVSVFGPCFLAQEKVPRSCYATIWLIPNGKDIRKILVACQKPGTRLKRSVNMNLKNATTEDIMVQQLVSSAVDKLEMSSIHKYKQRVFQINSYLTRIITSKETIIDFDVGYTSCLKYEWVDDVKSCDFLGHLPRRHCIAHVYERLWVKNGKEINVSCKDDETPLEAHVEFESEADAVQLANEALKHIEAKYPNPRRMKIVRIFSLEKQMVAGVHYRMKVEVGLTECPALSEDVKKCKLVTDVGLNKFCRVNVWHRPWSDHPPNFRVTCDYQETTTGDIFRQMQAEHLFSEFITTYKPAYLDDPEEMKKRFQIFKENIQKIQELNTHERGTARYAVTRFADLSYEEYSSKYLGLKTSLRDLNAIPMRQATIPDVKLPPSIDWRELGAVTEVKDQGSCGSCWAFSVTGNVEGQWKIKNGQLLSLSEQELVDCDKLDQGCNGGLPDNAYRAIEQLGGLELEQDYPYEAEGEKCSFNKTMAKVTIHGAVNITSNETDMAKWLVQNGPISIGINAAAMQFYVGGVSHPWRMLCSPKNLDHGVLIVGYGTKAYPLFNKQLPYWIVKNSWGDRWGEQGYYRVYRGDGTCGVNQMASSAIVDKKE